MLAHELSGKKFQIYLKYLLVLSPSIFIDDNFISSLTQMNWQHLFAKYSHLNKEFIPAVYVLAIALQIARATHTRLYSVHTRQQYQQLLNISVAEAKNITRIA